MRRFVPLLALLFACAELRTASTTTDAGAAPADGSAPVVEGGAANVPDADATMTALPAAVETVASDISLAGTLTADAQNVYFASDSSGIYQCAKSGCGHDAILLGTGQARRLAVAQGAVYWGDHDLLLKCSIGGCSGLPDSVLPDQTNIDEIASDGTTLVWATSAGAAGTLHRCTAATCAATVTTITTITSANVRPGIALGANIVVFGATDDAIRSCPLDAPCPMGATKLGPGFGDVAIAGSSAFWTNGANVEGCPLGSAGGCAQTPPRVIATTRAPGFTVADSTSVYWRDTTDDRIYRCHSDGNDCATPETIATDIGGGGGNAGLAVDADYIYWATKTGILRRRK